MRRSSRLVGWTAGLSAAIAAAAPPPELALEPTKSGLLAVPVEVGGEGMRWVLDTGAGRSMIPAALATRLALAPRARFDLVDARGTVRVALAGGPLHLRLGDTAVELPLVGWLPGGALFFEDEGFDGLLAADLLARVDLWVDAGAGRLQVTPTGGLGGLFGGTPVPLGLADGRPVVAVSLVDLARQPVELRLVIDSGADRTVLFGPSAERVAAARRALAVPASLTSAYGGGEIALALLGRARLGGAPLRLGRAALLAATRDREEDGLLPLSALGPVLFELAAGRVTVGARPRL